MRQGQRVGSPTEKVDEMRRGSCDEKQTGGFKGRVCNAAATMSVEAEDNGRCVSRQMETTMVMMIRCMRERWVRAWARASSGRGQASQSYLGSSRLGARVWGRRRKVWRVGSRYYQCCRRVQRVKGRQQGCEVRATTTLALTAAGCCCSQTGTGTESAAGRRARNAGGRARWAVLLRRLSHTRAQTSTPRSQHHQIARLFWACARPTPQLSIRVTGFARAAIRLTTAWRDCLVPKLERGSPKVEQAAVGRVLVLLLV